jgi:hypothetical protein
MARDRRSTETITALLSSAPALTPVVDAEERAGGTSRPVPGSNLPVAPKTAGAPAKNPSSLQVDSNDYDEVDLEAFELDVDRPLVRPRRRKEVDYQTVRINRPTARILRQQWLAARSIDPLVSFTEFATIVAQKGLRALAEERKREDPDLFD